MAKKKRAGSRNGPGRTVPGDSATGPDTTGGGTRESGRERVRVELPPWARWAAFLSLIGLNVFLLVRVANPSPHAGGDNAGYLTLAYSLLENGTYTDLYDPAQPAHTKYPPIYAMVLAVAMAVGARTWTAFKAVSGVAVLVSVALASGWAWRRRGWSFGLTIGLLLAFANTFIYHSQWILSDPVFLAFTLMALLAFDRVDTLVRPPADGNGVRDVPVLEQAWLAVGGAATILAFFTRSAGLPLVLAVFTWLALRRQRRAFVLFAAAFGVPALLWWIRSKALGGPGYVGEFWLLNPYQPDLGTVGPLGLFDRFVSNAWLYIGTEIPAGLIGVQSRLATALGFVIVALAIAGWVKRLRFVGVAELFVPLYLGLILLWPEVWSGDRFALPLYAPILFYAGESFVRATRPLSRYAPVIAGAVVVVALLIPSAGAWRRSARQADICRSRVQAGAFGCYQARMQEFVAAAEWSTASLPEGSVVLTRKPRIFYLLSGVPSAVFPFSDDPQVLADAADAIGARYVLVDYIDQVTAFYLVPILQQRPQLFCSLAGFGGDERGVQTQLMGIDASAEGARRVTEEEGSMRVELMPCSQTEFVAPGGAVDGQSDGSGVVPLLRSLDS